VRRQHVAVRAEIDFVERRLRAEADQISPPNFEHPVLHLRRRDVAKGPLRTAADRGTQHRVVSQLWKVEDGAGLRAYTEYERVELPNGDELAPEQFLVEVQREVIDTVLEDVFEQPRSGIGSIDPPTQLYVMGRFEFGGAFVAFDHANTLARGIGVELSGPRGALAGAKALFKKEKSKVRLRDYRERGAVESLGAPAEGGAAAPLIDVLHRLLWLAENEPLAARDFVQLAVGDPQRLRLVAQALSGPALERKGAGTSGREQQAIASLLTGWKRLVDDTLAGGRG
jgi:putative DNA methylase